jgi:hypothetical protein
MAKSTVSFPDRRFWSYGHKGWTKELGTVYAIGIWDLELEKYAKMQLSLERLKFVNDVALYEFDPPPNSYTISEPAAISITPLQNQGRHVEGQGNLFKDIKVAGTTGLRPSPASNQLVPGLKQATGVSLTKPRVLNRFTRDERGLDPSELTGYDKMMFLRNLFRAYYDLKGGPDSNKYTMIWQAFNEGEFYAVEPVSFSTERSSGNPFGFEYQIQLKTVYKLDQIRNFEFDTVSLFQAISNINNNIRALGMDLFHHLNEISTHITSLALLPGTLTDMVLSVGADIVRGLAAVGNSVESFSDVMERSTVAAYESNARAIGDALHDVETSREDYDSTYMSMSTRDLFNSIRRIQRNANSILAMDSLWQSANKQNNVTNQTQAYVSALGENPFTSGSPLDPQNIVIPESTKQEKVNHNDTIRGLAKKYLGNEAEWKKLAIVNNLKAPYISSASSPGVLGPNDYIIIPIKAQDGDKNNQVAQQYGNDSSYAALDPMSKKYGRDLRLTDSATSSRSADLVVNQRGDLDYIEGQANVEQAIRVKFATKKGELSLHPQYGNGIEHGRKSTLVRFQKYAMNTRNTILQDPRIEGIEDLKVFAEGDVVNITAKIMLRKSNAFLPFLYSIRS